MVRSCPDPTEDDLAALKRATVLLKRHPLTFTKSIRLSDLLADQLQAWSWMGDVDLDALDRECWEETILLAREIINIREGLK